eukprot:TRINITY_DN42333_c0_g1_i1.p1 TRINITY_DN42333_c0_g1~~TRINITY_DN42333_c0_g1_i1.p1  ORF type:complete len:152 (+),score=31.73 TRINITY_DN42333_c0_g1_i1:69-458(+)
MGNAESTIPIGDRKLRVKQRLAEGGYSFVDLVEDVKTHELFALKKMLAQDEEGNRLALAEIDLLKSLPPHPNILKFYGACVKQIPKSTTSEYFLLTEYCSNGHLGTYLSHRRSPLTEQEILTIFLKICK